jgi:hypothetical protein
MEAIERLNLTIQPHPAYSPDLAPCDFHLFPKLKEDLCGHQYALNEEVKGLSKSGCGNKVCCSYVAEVCTVV